MGKSSTYRGVTLFRPTGKWRAQVNTTLTRLQDEAIWGSSRNHLVLLFTAQVASPPDLTLMPADLCWRQDDEPGRPRHRAGGCPSLRPCSHQ